LAQRAPRFTTAPRVGVLPLGGRSASPSWALPHSRSGARGHPGPEGAAATPPKVSTPTRGASERTVAARPSQGSLIRLLFARRGPSGCRRGRGRWRRRLRRRGS